MSTTKHPWVDYLFVGLGTIGYSLGFLYRGALAPIIDALQTEFHTNSTGIGSMSSSFYIGYTLMQIPSGLILEIYSAPLILCISTFGLGLCILAFGFTSNLISASLVQFICGIFIGPLFLASTSVGDQKFGAKNLAFVVGMIFATSFAFQLGGTTFQAWLYDAYNIWRQFFWFTGIGTIFVAIILFFVIINDLNKTSSENRITDSLKNPIIEHEMDTFSENSPLMDANKKKSKTNNWYARLVYRNINASNKGNKIKHLLNGLKPTIKNYLNWIVGMFVFCVAAIFIALNGVWLISFFIVKFNYSRTWATIISGLFYASSGIGGVVAGKIAAIYPKKKKLIVICGALLNISGIVMIYVCTPSTPVAVVTLLNCASGFGTILSVVFSLAREYNSENDCADTALGFILTIGNAAGFVIPFVIGELMDYNWSKRGGSYNEESNEREYSTDDYEFSFIVMIVCLIIEILCAFMLKQN